MATSASNITTGFATTRGGRLAYRSFGQGIPIILCNRFRGVLDSWNSCFISRLAEQFQVILFDARGTGRSCGCPASDLDSMVADVIDLGRFLGLCRFIVGGWSLGGIVAQSVAARHSDLVSHLVLIGTVPPGRNAHRSEPLFTPSAEHFVHELDDELILFFEPATATGEQAARFPRGSATSLQPPSRPRRIWSALFELNAEFAEDRIGARERQKTSGMPTLVVSGDHDLVFPVENWFALNREHLSLQLLVYPRSGHAPQPHHQHPEATANAIHDFIHNNNNWTRS